jgi:hypothetical protein
MPGEIDSITHSIRGWVGPGAGLDAMEKRKISYTCRELNPGYSPAQPVTQLSYSGSWSSTYNWLKYVNYM